MVDGKAFAEQLFAATQSYVVRMVERLRMQAEQAEQAARSAHGRIETFEQHVEHQLKALPAAGPQGERGEKGEPGESVVGPVGERGEKGEPGESIVGPQGERGTDGKSVTLAEIEPIVQAGIDDFIKAAKSTVDTFVEKSESNVSEFLNSATAAVAALPIPKDGIAGMNGKDGASVTVEDMRPMFETELAKWALEFERRATDLIQRCIERIEKPKDGVPGKDGRDALDLENFEIALSEDERTLTVALVRGETRVERSVQLHHPLYRGIYKDGDHYHRGDTVTYGGSQWSAMRDTASKPETDDSWRLSVKRGRDGKDGAPGPRGPEGRKGKDGGRYGVAV